MVLLGPPASGKGTHGRNLSKAFGLGYLSTGAVLREHVENRTELGKLADPILARGGYLPDDLMCRIIGEWLARQPGGWVLDGFPRSVPQAEFLDDWLAGRGLELDAAISLEAPFEVLISRMRDRLECPECRWSGKGMDECPDCGAALETRPDDSDANFTSRYREFQRHTLPVIEHYRGRNLLSPCDATAPRDEVAAEILARFGSGNGR